MLTYRNIKKNIGNRGFKNVDDTNTVSTCWLDTSLLSGMRSQLSLGAESKNCTRWTWAYLAKDSTQIGESLALIHLPAASEFLVKISIY